jgi:hypothetical protein
MTNTKAAIDAAFAAFSGLSPDDARLTYHALGAHLRANGVLPQEQPAEPAVKRGRPRGSRTRVKPDKSMGVPE